MKEQTKKIMGRTLKEIQNTLNVIIEFLNVSDLEQKKIYLKSLLGFIKANLKDLKLKEGGVNETKNGM